MNDIHPDLFEAVESVEILEVDRYVLRGETYEIPPDPDGSETVEARLLADLETNLYERVYFRTPLEGLAAGQEWLDSRDLLASLSQANSGQGTLEPGWTIQNDSEPVIVARRGMRFWVGANEIDQSDGTAETCHVRVPKELRYLQPGHYYAFGDARKAAKTDVLLRYYWHLNPTSAAGFVKSATMILNAAGIPFELKVPTDPEGYARADAGVLYVARRHAAEAGRAVALIHQSIAQGLRPEVPLFTRKLADGLALAEDPGDSRSFGQHRCRLVARAVWQAFVQGERDLQGRAAILAEIFRNEGLDPRHPYLGIGSSVDALRAAEPTLLDRPTALTGPRNSKIRPTPLEAASRIGETLCRSAHWDRSGRLCNWTARWFTENGPEKGSSPAYSALGPGIYHGSAGVGLFLAELHALTGDVDCRRTALGAMNRSVRQADRRPGELTTPLSYFDGFPGLACSSIRMGTILGDEALVAQGETLVERVPVLAAEPHFVDFLNGSAGSIVALIRLGRVFGTALATTLGEKILDRAIRNEGAWTWDPEVTTGPGVALRMMTGMSHGAAGIGLALLELHEATARTDFLDAASGAFASEDALFDPTRGNWLDLRGIVEPGAAPRPRAFGRVWCQGAPGIALARLRAMALDPTRAECHEAMARVAIATTLRAIDDSLESPRSDLSLCHGLAGLMEIAQVAGRLLDDPDCRTRAARIAETLIDRLDPEGSGDHRIVPIGSRPALMVGLAGVGHALLRLHSPERVPSVLLVD